MSVFLLVILAGMTAHTFAGGTKTITRGQSAVINWAVTGAPSCYPSTNYPNNAGDSVTSIWSSAGNSTSGSVTFPSVYTNGTFAFSCTDLASGISDSATLIVNDCAVGTTWNGTSCVAPASCTGSGPLSWGSGCGTTYTGTVSSGSSATVYNTNTGYTGSQNYSCNNGTFTLTSQSCSANACTNGATNPPTCNTCSTGYVWNGTSCVAPASCTANGPLSWGSGCGTTYSGTISSGSSVTVDNTNTGYTGSQNYSCNNGTWSLTSQSCTAGTCTNGATNPPTCNTCSAGYTWNGTSCVVSACTNNATNPPTCNTCSAGYTWNGTSCALSNGGAFNGICNTPEYTCYAGQVGNMAYSNGTYTWTCSGGNGGSGVSCSYSYLPDLTATEVSIPGTTSTYSWTYHYTVSTTANAGTATTFNSTIRNQGNASTGKSFYNFMQVATAANGGGTITDLAPSLMATLDLSTTNTASATYTFPAGGTYSVRACADKSSSGDIGTITETNETNNCGTWTTVNVTGGAPQVINSSLTGNNTAQGTLSFSCTYSTLYSITRAEGPTGVFPITNAPYSGPVSVNLTVAGNYSVICSNSTASSSPAIYNYDPTPVSSGLILVATPTTTKSGSMTTLSWNIASPTNTCSLTAAAVYPAGATTTDATKEAAAAALTAQFTNPSQTDANDPYGQRAMLTALRTAAPGMTSNAIGKKTVVIHYTTDFTLNCGTSSARKVRVQVTNENEG